MITENRILICQHLTCRKQGAAKVLAAFRSAVISDEIIVEGCGCLGQCGNGPNLVILPAEIWYYHVSVNDVPNIIAKLLDGD